MWSILRNIQAGFNSDPKVVLAMLLMRICVRDFHGLVFTELQKDFEIKWQNTALPEDITGTPAPYR